MVIYSTLKTLQTHWPFPLPQLITQGEKKLEEELFPQLITQGKKKLEST